ncbi:MAG: manganese efflux pump [Desulfotomaculum sp.]|nr:manganese efflux pump [Desulfotomaculum sp.]
MSLATLLLLAAALGTDAMSLCVGIGMSGVIRRQILILTFTIALFHVIMPIIGYHIGELVGTYVDRAAAIAGALLLIYLGARMLKNAFSAEEESRVLLATTGGLVVLAGSVSMDALSVGFTLGTQEVNLYQAAAVMGAVAGIMTYSGLAFGDYVGSRIGNKAQIVGGIILIGIGIKLIF